MKKKIVIKSFSDWSYEPVLQRPGMGDLGWPRLAHPRLRFTPESVQGLNAQPRSLAVAEPVQVRSTFDEALNPSRGEDTDTRRKQCLSGGC